MIDVNNGKEQIPWVEGMTVRDVLHACNYTFSNLLVTVNGMIVPRESYETYLVQDRDRVLALHFFGGG
ncbi:MAG: sulfur carrier protein ThiS [Chloroflexi bacterium]|nr:sulfur carrier protein ThiS [Chloroflexota bacterium]MBU1752035.1 sulfur carrier protein ThiS [Chloroflexota bacterium]